MNNDIEWKEGAVCFAGGYQWFYESNYPTLSSTIGYPASYESLVDYDDFQLNTIKQGDCIPKSELDTEGKYNRAVEVFGLFGFPAYERDPVEALRRANEVFIADCESSFIGASENCLEAERKITFNQLIAIGELKRLMNERESNHSAKPNSSVSKVNRDIERSKQSTTLTTEEETELKSLCMVSALNNEIENQKTWPQVGDHALIQRGAKVTVRCIVGDLAWCACPESSMNMITVNLSNLSKPKSKEDLLIEELQNKLVNNNAVDSYILACDIINGDIDGLSYVGDNMSDTKD